LLHLLTTAYGTSRRSLPCTKLGATDFAGALHAVTVTAGEQSALDEHGKKEGRALNQLHVVEFARGVGKKSGYERRQIG
jgi:hypothetical protein